MGKINVARRAVNTLGPGKNTPMNDHTASDWYETQALSDSIFLIREKHVAHWLRCNIWLVKGREGNLVIDSGMGLSPLKPRLLALAGSSLTAVMTHCHFDHVGGLFEFEKRLETQPEPGFFYS